jgi:hypothetical protein
MAIFLRFLGVKQTVAATAAAVSTRHPRSREKTFEAAGLSSLLPKPKSGRPAKLPPTVVGWIAATMVRLGALSPSLICQRLAKEYHLTLCHKTIRKVIMDYRLSVLLLKTSQEESVGRTFFGGLWLLLPCVLKTIPTFLGRTTREVFVTLIATSLLGITRRFHFRDVHAVGLATLGGTPQLLDGSTVRNR